MGSWYNATTGYGLQAPMSGVLTRCWQGAIQPGQALSICDLVGLYRGDTVLIQHTLNSGLIRLGGKFAPPLYYRTNFEAPSYLSGGILTGQCGWFQNVGFPVVWDPRPRLVSSTLLEGHQLLGDGDYSGGIAGTSLPEVALLQTLGAADPFVMDWRHIIADTPVGADVRRACFVMNPANAYAGTGACMFQVNINNDGSLLIFDGTNVAGLVVAGAGVGTHRFTVTGDALGNLIYYEDGVAIAAGTRLAGFTTGNYLEIIFEKTGAAVDAALHSHMIDDIVINGAVIAANGWPIPNGTGQELYAHLKPLDLTDLSIVCQLGGNAATVNVMVIGS